MMNEFIFDGVLNGDLDSVIKEIDYSTRPREIVTVGQMVDEFRKENPFLYLLTFGLTINGLTHLMKPVSIKTKEERLVKLTLSSRYGKMGDIPPHDISSMYPSIMKPTGLKVKGMIIDEFA